MGDAGPQPTAGMALSPKANSRAAWAPAGTSMVAGRNPTLLARARSVDVPARRTGRVWGTGEGKAPSPTTISTFSRATRATTSAMNWFHRMSGSGPLSTSIDRPVRLVATSRLICGQRSSVSTPLTIRRTGRRAR